MIFDRVRERLRTTGRGEIGAAVNAAVTDTLGRTIITSGQTLAAVLALYLFGGTVLQGFAFTLLVGIVAGHVVHGVVAAPVAALLARRPPLGKLHNGKMGEPNLKLRGRRETEGDDG